ncbi:hypothetical protein RFF05_13970 [Bengtsoniella intestinalis]|uniref:hypothetical protein n=1 Tax=Bengtsoniella intestinalis TaxID=3073143 RepID=UPI00391F61AE
MTTVTHRTIYQQDGRQILEEQRYAGIMAPNSTFQLKGCVGKKMVTQPKATMISTNNQTKAA